MGGFSSPQPGLQMCLLSGLAGTMRPSPHTHGFGRGNVRFDEQPTVHCFSPTESANDASLRPMDLDSSEIKPGMTPILPDERCTSFSKWCDSRRTRVNDSEDLRRKKTRALTSSLSTSRGIVGYESRGSADSRRSPMGQTLRGSPGMGFGGLAGASSAADRWWLDPKWDGHLAKWEGQAVQKVSDYCQQLLAESGSRVVSWDAMRMQSLAPQTSQGLEPAAALLEQTSRGIRRWLGLQVVRHVLAIMDHVEKDAADGLHKPVAPKAAAAAAAPAPAFGVPFGQPGAFGAPAAAGGGFGARTAPFGASAAPQQQQQAAASAAASDKAKQEEEEETKRGNAFDRRNQVVCFGAVFSARCARERLPASTGNSICWRTRA